MKQFICMALLTLLCVGCYKYATREIKILSDPPGCNVEVDGNLIGKTPTSTNIQIKLNYVGVMYARGGYDVDRPYRTVNIIAYPLFAGQYTQHKILTYEDIIEKDITTVYFDMNLGPSPKQYEIQIENK